MLTETVRLLLAPLAVHRAAQMLALDEGPFSVFQWMRELAGGYDLDEQGRPKTGLGRLSICTYCLGLWLAVGAMLLVIYPSLAGDIVLVVFAVAGAQSLIQDYSLRGQI